MGTEQEKSVANILRISKLQLNETLPRHHKTHNFQTENHSQDAPKAI